jgi:hypothetical protein
MVSVFRFASLGLIIIGAQLHGNRSTSALPSPSRWSTSSLPLALAVEIGHRAGGKAPVS